MLQAYKKHVKKWFMEGPDSPEQLVVRYEDLLTKPEQEFQRVFDYLDLDCPLAKEFLSRTVSLYDTTREHRARVAAWQHHAGEYKVLLKSITKNLSSELKTLGYEDAGAGSAPGKGAPVKSKSS